MSGLVALSPPELPRVDAITVNGTVFAFAFGIATLIGLVVGLIPALHASRTDPHTGLHESSRRTAGSHQWTRRTLVVAEVALALVLLVSAGLLLRSLERLFAVTPGFDASHVLTMEVQVSGQRFRDETAMSGLPPGAGSSINRSKPCAMFPALRRRAFTSLLPMSGDQSGEYGAQFENDTPQNGTNVFRYVATPGYCETMGIALRRGRLLDDRDAKGAPASRSDQPIAGPAQVWRSGPHWPPSSRGPRWRARGSPWWAW